MELGFEVDDMTLLRAKFAEYGVSGFQPQSMNWGEVVEGHDLDGYRVIVYCFR